MALQPNGRGPGEEIYVPVLTATTTDPDLGTGGSIEGGWQPVGPSSLVYWWAVVTFGTSPDPGSGYYQISLPHTPVSEPGRGVGDGMVIDASASNELRPVRAGCAAALVTALSGEPNRPFLFDLSAPAGLMDALVGDAAPFVWAAGDQINVSGLYQRLL